MSGIRERVKEFSDEFLLDQYHNNQHEFTPETIVIMEEEIAARNLAETSDTVDDDANQQEELEEHLKEEFVPIDHGFSQTDLPLATEILAEASIPFYVQDSQSSGAIVIESEVMHTFTLFTPQSLLEKARESLGELFDKSEGRYAVKFSSVKDRLKSFCFHEAPLPWNERQVEIDVQFSATETAGILKLMERLEKEADKLEEESGKVLFYIDNLQECSQHLSENNRTSFSKSDLLTILEALQVYCDDPAFPQVLDTTAEALLDFFIK